MSCGTDTTILRLIVQDVVSQLLKDGTLQGGLLDCNDKPLPAQRKIPQCEAVTDTTVTKFELDGRTLKLTLSDKTELTVELPEVPEPPKAELPKVSAKRYHATALLVFETNDCRTAQQAAVGYHPNDTRDPAATVPYFDKDGSVLAWLYPASASEHSVPVYRDGAVVGYGMGAGVATYLSYTTGEADGAQPADKPTDKPSNKNCDCPKLISLGNVEITGEGTTQSGGGCDCPTYMSLGNKEIN